jgi:hypothetical protein
MYETAGPTVNPCAQHAAIIQPSCLILASRHCKGRTHIGSYMCIAEVMRGRPPNDI